MIVVLLVILGLCFGSFVNAAVWRIRAQEQVKSKKLKVKRSTNLSIIKGRSVCPYCEHELTARDLVPVLSWLSLGGKCRYCKKPISLQYPLVELFTAGLFILSYLYWPLVSKDGPWNGQAATLFIFWLVLIIGFMILTVYDLRWQLLPNKVVYPLLGLAVIQTILLITVFNGGKEASVSALWGLVIGGGIFYAIFQVSGGKWIGGGDVKLGAMLGLFVGGPLASLLLLFTASLLGTIAALPLLITGKATRSSRVPFGPFLIAAGAIVYIFGGSIIAWYKRRYLLY